MSFESYLKDPYKTENYVYILKDILPNFSEQKGAISVNDSQKEKVASFNFLGKSTMNGKDVLGLEVELKGNVEASPTFQRNLVAQFLQKQIADCAVVAYHNDIDKAWKIALVTVSYKFSGEGIKKEISEAKRYYYVVGQDNIHTAQTQLESLKVRANTLEDLVNAFSIEKVTKEFFFKIANKFYDLVGEKIQRENKEEVHKGILELPSTNDNKVKQEFSIRLLSRIIFSWFLKKKGLISDEILSSKAVKDYKNSFGIELTSSESYYHSVLEPLFFEVMNKKQDNRDPVFKNVKEFIEVPFLNGGLFEPRRDEDFYDASKDQYFKRAILSLKINDQWFIDLFHILERYNFTVEESTPIDIELSIDPEMLGRIFENLLAEINEETSETARKLTGSYYTPRDIVDYMVTESLQNYFKDKTKLSEDKIQSLLSYSEENIKLTNEEAKAIVDAIDSVKIIDPACGSGAFPIGAMQKLLLCLKKVDPDNRIWLEKMLSKIEDPILRDKAKEKLQNENYVRKLGILRNSIYGVDIQPMAVELSKLRAFLTLIVDARVDKLKPNYGIEPLPNLEFKFVCANSLIGLPLPQGPRRFSESPNDIEVLKELRNKYFISYGEEKNYIERDFKNIQSGLFKKALEWISPEGNLSETYMLSSWEPFSNKPSSWLDQFWMFGVKDGFDIVIANPPYVRQEKIKDQKENLKKQRYEVFNSTSDLYTYFYEKGCDLLKDGGILTFISSNKWMRAKYGEKLRKFLKEKTTIKEIIDFGGYKVFDATVDTNVIVFEKRKLQGKNEFLYLNVEGDFDGRDIVGYFNKKGSVMEQSDLSDPAWTLADDKVLALKKKIEKIGIPLKNWDVKIYRGIITGFNEAFVIKEKQKIELENYKNKHLFFPLIRGKDIKKYKIKRSGLYLIYSTPESIPDIEMYPKIKNHFLKFKDKMENMSHVKNGRKWWTLQDPKDLNVFEGGKIFYPDISNEGYFAFSKELILGNNTVYFIKSNSLFLLAYLNSKINRFYYKQTATSLSGNAFRYFTHFVEQLPIPKISESEQKPFVNLVDKILAITKDEDYLENTAKQANVREYERQIDQMVYSLYGITEDEIKVIEKGVIK